MPRLSFAFAACVAFSLATGASAAFAQTTDSQTSDAGFQDWLAGVRQEALSRGIGASTLDAAFKNTKPVPRVLELDKRQPEFTRSIWGYLDSFVTQDRIDRGRQLLVKHKALLDKVHAKYGVQPRFLVAFWGMETNFGDYTGGFSVIDAIATLAYDPRRSDFFRNELFQALTILDEGHITPDAMVGSWAGAMGQPQFMPSTFTAYAADGDGDGHKDIWNNLPDVFASAAHYLSSIGWDDTETWGREVKLPSGFDVEQADLKIRKDISEWQALGVRRADGRDLPAVAIDGSIVLPSGVSGPAFLVYGNFRAIMTWNRALNYALAVGILSDRLEGKGGLLTKRPVDDKPLHRDEILELQRRLTDAGFDTGKPDGMVGPMTRAAVKGYQKSVGLPPDGYPTPALLSKLRGG
ncbi:lytic murein transglycosylase [Rhodospirillaceae bacterium KN72]|uniref:Lytic murein transglycosylase n=1 Tax=Pacificispira spongiicola TaxID=2729598 RepID=A0A7Y0E2E0_9PROT|nr:lytic murein transglycosylase [Pacificispira spongiicola]NMM45960.1 lytic murein transglycosylase [Pacificispira spongiicola]